jgi:shikimate kinase/3-dehydroquinate synthase
MSQFKILRNVGIDQAQSPRIAALVSALGDRSIVLVGMMGSGKTSTGRRLAQKLGLGFVDADAEIEAAAGLSIPEIFARHGEAHFREGERKVMARLLAQGPRVIATGGGAYMNEETRRRIAETGISVWLKADVDVLLRRVRKRSHRPLLHNPDPEKTLKKLIDDRYPVYARADITAISRDGPHETVVDEIIEALEFFLRFSADPPAALDVTHNMSLVDTLPALERVEVKLGTRAYDILIGQGLIADAGEYIRRFAPGAACAIVTDENVARHHLAPLEESLDAAKIRHTAIVVAPGEASKSFPVFEHVCDSILAAKLERGDLVLALGGGVVGDLAGFAAASVRRGMRFIQMPTSLLAQVDSSVGGKTGINSALGKNLIGAFHQPSLVLADTAALETLPAREFRAGYAEILKYGLIDDLAFFEWLEGNWHGVFDGGPARAQAIAKSCSAKASVVARDELEKGDRALLNLGHTFGHAFEQLTNYAGARLVHGEGVAIGMACAFRLSVRLGLCSGQDAGRVEAHLRAVGLPARISDIPGFDASAGEILHAMYQDKKVQHGALTFILARGIGRSFIAKNVDADEVQAFLQSELCTTGH